MPGIGDNVDFNTGNMYGRTDAYNASPYGTAATTGGSEGTDKLCIVAQTTITRELWDKSLESLKNGYTGEMVVFDTICSATNNRQTAAIELAQRMDAMIVVGGKHSSNTRKLAEVCQKHCEITYHVETPDELVMTELKKYDKIGITAGASTPDWIIHAIIHKLENEGEGNNSGK